MKWYNNHRVLPPIFISTILQNVLKAENFQTWRTIFHMTLNSGYWLIVGVFLANQNARNAIVRAENLLKGVSVMFQNLRVLINSKGCIQQNQLLFACGRNGIPYCIARDEVKILLTSTYRPVL